MLRNLAISNIVLIEKLNLEFGSGLNVLTGETGAGKSILLDALSLAMGARSDVSLIRHGCDMANVVAEFYMIGKKINEILSENGIDFDDSLILRRSITTDGKSRAWINDIPVSVKVLKQIGDNLVEIHGQFENHSLLDQTTHQKTLDDYASLQMPGYSELLLDVKSAYVNLAESTKKLKELENMLERSAIEREFLEYNVAELSKLNPQIGEEEELNNARNKIINAEKNTAILTDAVQVLNKSGDSIDSLLFNSARILERIKTDENPYQEQIDKLYTVAEDVSNIIQKLKPVDADNENVDDIEERLFALRAAARKHRVSADELSNLFQTMQEKLAVIDNSDAELNKLKSDIKIKKQEFDRFASKLSSERKVAADILRKNILSELPDLKLGQADFMVQMEDKNPSSNGADEITFMIKTNPGSPFAPLHKTASGGELARLMLALRVVFINPDDLGYTFVFDEVDTGISGATAGAVGNRLNRLAKNSQALVITHSAQVAGYADKHFKIQKTVLDNSTKTSVIEIMGDDKINEIARIISGSEITTQAIETAKTLIKTN